MRAEAVAVMAAARTRRLELMAELEAVRAVERTAFRLINRLDRQHSAR